MKALWRILGILALLGLTACAGSGREEEQKWSSDYPDGRVLYLRGDMNDWEALPEQRLRKVGEGLYMTEAKLVAAQSPYKFKYADRDWTPGCNFGYAKGSGEYHLGGNAVPLTPRSMFEEIVVSVDTDGTYEFYLDIRGEKPLAYVVKMH